MEGRVCETAEKDEHPQEAPAKGPCRLNPVDIAARDNLRTCRSICARLSAEIDRLRLTNRDHFAAAALTGLLCNGDYSMESMPCHAFSMADAMLRERERTNHDAVPAAIAVSDEDRTDKAAPSQCRDRPGDAPDRPQPIKDGDSDRSYPIGIDPAAYEGDIVSRLRHWRHRHLAHCGELFEAAADEIDRLRTVMYRIVDEDCTVAIQNGTFYADGEPLFAISGTNEPRNGAVVGPDPDSRVWETPVHTPATQTTPGECSKPRECTEPVAWAALERDGFGIEGTFTDRDEAAEWCDNRQQIVPLYRHPPCQDSSQKNLTLTDCERGAIERAVDSIASTMPYESQQGLADWKTLRGLLERLGGGR